MVRPTAPVDAVTARAYRVETDSPEADGTLAWSATTMVVAMVRAGGSHGLGYSYTDALAAGLIERVLAPGVLGRDAMDLAGIALALRAQVRNIGLAGLCATAISAVDVALWDLKAKLLDVSLLRLLGAARDSVPVYGSGGFTSYDKGRLQEQLADWVGGGIGMVKMKVGRHPERDVERVGWARQAIGDDARLFVDANGAYQPAQALRMAGAFAEHSVSWFEEPVTADDIAGLRHVRGRAPPGMAIAAGEYGYTDWDFHRLLQAGAVDVLQADATRCCGISGFLRTAALCQAWGIPLSAHTAPSLHATVCCAAAPAIHVEYFHDHARIERMLFDGMPPLDGGQIRPDTSRPGLGLALSGEADRYAIRA